MNVDVPSLMSDTHHKPCYIPANIFLDKLFIFITHWI